MKKICYAIGGRINFNEGTISLCHGIDIGDRDIWEYSSGIAFTPEFYLKKIAELNEANQREHPLCEGCSNLLEGGEVKKKIEVVTINPLNFCQNRCVYCGNFQGDIHELYNPLPIIKQFIQAGLIAEHCLFDWGGGEPTLCNCFEEIFLYLKNSGYMQRVNTNAIRLNNILLENFDDDLVTLRFSIDSGNAQTFLATKGRNLFNQVIENIKKYRERTDNIVLKYVITNTNSDKTSIEDFVDLVVSLDINTICIDTDMFSYGRNHYDGLLRFTEKELEAAHLLRKLAHERGLNVQIGYVWTSQNKSVPSRDFNEIYNIKELNKSNEMYQIPMKLLPIHIKRLEEYKNRIFPVVLASFETLLDEMRNKKVVLYGAGINGRNLLICLIKYGIDVISICDKNRAGQCIEGMKIENVEEGLERIKEGASLIITPYLAKDIVLEFNDRNYEFLKGKLYYIDSSRYSEKALEDIECVY